MLLRTALVLGLCVAPMTPVLAQEMPDWARPGDGMPSETPTETPPEPDPRGPSLPADPAPVPINGLFWLALAGAGYAAHRLRR